MKVTIGIPAFNEENNIERLVKKIKSKFKDSLIIIVDDSHHKKTWHLIRKKKLRVNYIHRGKKLGRGSAVIFGLKKLIKNKNAITILWHNSQIEHMNIYEQLIDYLYDEELIRK